MDGDLMLTTIDARGELGGRRQALEAAGAVLSVLGEHLASGEPANLAAQLPAELAGALPIEGSGQAFGAEEFDRRVAERVGGRHTPAEVHRHAVAVLTTVLEAVSPGQRDDVAGQLSEDYEDFLPAGTARHWRGGTSAGRRPGADGDGGR